MRPAAATEIDTQPAAEPRHVFNVSRSLNGRSWRPREFDQRTANAIAEHHDLPLVIARILSARGVALDDLPQFLAPTLKDLMPDPSVLCDMDRAASRIADAIVKGEKIAVLADYDVDGAASAALVAR